MICCLPFFEIGFPCILYSVYIYPPPIRTTWRRAAPFSLHFSYLRSFCAIIIYQCAGSSQNQAAAKEWDAQRTMSDVPAAPINTAVGGKASLQPKRTPVSDREIDAILVSKLRLFFFLLDSALLPAEDGSIESGYETLVWYIESL